MKISIFSGGRGCTSIIKSLFFQTDAAITILVNAYDNGKSTGRIREFIPGMLGPSDIRKNFSTILECYQLDNLADFLEQRLLSNTTGLSTIDFVRTSLPEHFSRLSYSTFESILAALNEFDRFSAKKNEIFDTNDCAVGNLIFAGVFLQCKGDFNLAVRQYQSIFFSDESRLRILNVTDGENLFLVARSESGRIFRDEEEIVLNVEAESIREVALTNFESTQFSDSLFSKPYSPEPNPDALDNLGDAEIIIYGPGTQASSLLPSYLTNNLLEVICSNASALKVFISNLVPDFDDPSSDLASRLNTFYKIASRVIELESIYCLISHVFSELQVDNNLSKFLAFDSRQITFQTDNWLIEANRHLGPAIVRQLAIASDGRLESRPGFVTLIATQPPSHQDFLILEAMLSEQQLGLDFEIVTLKSSKFPWRFPSDKFSESANGVRIYSNIAEALEWARGDLIAYIEDLRLYSPTDLLRAIDLMRSETVQLVLGSRNLKILDLRAQIRKAYPSNRLRGLISYWGSLLISISILLKYRRFISDPLSGIKVFRRSALGRDSHIQVSRDLNINLIKHFIKKDLPIQQIEIGYNPKFLDNYNRHNFLDGLLSLARIWKF
jgi:2-phospho-L-lactate transferase/gluconeogenesis factor (CofD/UPF0052 family)